MLSKRECCCGGVGCLDCSRCQIPKKDLMVLFNGGATATLAYMSSFVAGKEPCGTTDIPFWFVCFNDPGGTFSVRVRFNCHAGYLIDWGVATACNALFFTPVYGCTFGEISLIDYTCNPFNLHFRINPNAGPGTYSGYYDLYVYDPDAGPYYDDGPCPCDAIIHVTGCGGPGLPGATVEIKDHAGSVVDSGTTDSNGNWTPTVNGGPFTIVVSKSRFDTKTINIETICKNGTITVSMSPASGYTCLQGLGCPDPVSNTLTATHSFFGTTSATVSLGVAWNFVWSYAYPGFGACVANTVSLGVQFSNVGMFNPTSPIVWPICFSALGCLVSTGAGCPWTGGDGSAFDGASPVRTSFACPPSFSWSGDITYNIVAGTPQSEMYGGLTGVHTFTLTITE